MLKRVTVERITRISLFALIFAMAFRVMMDTDVWWHLRSGATTLTQGFIYRDTLSSTRNGAEWVNHSWGAQVILYGVYRLVGESGLSLLTATFATLGMMFVYRACVGTVYARAFLLVLGASAAAVFWSPRPQMFSFMLSAVYLYILYGYKRQQFNGLVWLPVLMVAWVNLHGGYAIGFILVGAFIVAEGLAWLFNRGGEAVLGWKGMRSLMVVGCWMVLATLLNPYTYRILLIPFQTVGIQTLHQHIQEWQSPNFKRPEVLPFVALLLGSVVLLGSTTRRMRWVDGLLFCGTGYLALSAGRNIALFAVAVLPMLSEHVQAILEHGGVRLLPKTRTSTVGGVVNLVLLAGVLLGVSLKCLHVSAPTTLQPAHELHFPQRATAYLHEHPLAGKMFNSYNWGGYLTWFLPDHPVFVDGRTDLYGDELLQDYMTIYTLSDDGFALLAQYQIDWVIVEAYSPVGQQLPKHDGWRVHYQDEQAIVLAREAEAN